MTRSRSRIIPENPNYNPTTSLAHLILAGTSGWALKQIHNNREYYLWSFGAFTILLGHSLIGVLYYGHPNIIKSLSRLHDITTFIVKTIPVPFINADLYKLYNFSQKTVLIHTFSGIAPILTQYFKEKHIYKVHDIVMIANIGSLLYISMLKDNAWGSGLAALLALNNFVFRRVCEHFDVPKVDVLAISLSFFTIFGVNCLSEVSREVPNMYN